MQSIFLPDAQATDALGARLAATLPPRAVVHLRGDLGAGKSTLARAVLRALGVTGTIRSPTYTLVEQYPLAGGGQALHLDLYRIADPFLRFWFRFVEPNRSRLEAAPVDAVRADIERAWAHHVGSVWEDLARASVPRINPSVGP